VFGDVDGSRNEIFTRLPHNTLRPLLGEAEPLVRSFPRELRFLISSSCVFLGGGIAFRLTGRDRKHV